MTRIDFYFNAANKVEVVCKLVFKALAADKCIFIYTRDEAQLRSLDSYLWAAHPLSFLPHVSSGHKLAAKSPVVLGGVPDKLSRPDVLINFTSETPDWFGRFDRLLEVVTDDLHDKEMARNRFRQFKSMGYPVEVHDLMAAK
jgi:DNA polymerase-3 subunit chi